MATQVTKPDVSADARDAAVGAAGVRYATALVPPGARVEAQLVVDGKVLAVIPWTATAKVARNALAQMRLRVSDNCGVDTVQPPEERADG